MSMKFIVKTFIVCLFLGMIGSGAFCADAVDDISYKKEGIDISGRGDYLLVAQARVKVCPKCGHKNLAKDMFCSECGAKLPRRATRAPQAKRTKVRSRAAGAPDIGSSAYIRAGIQTVPGKYFAQEWLHESIETGVIKIDTYTVTQVEEDIDSSCMMVRIGMMFPLDFSRKLLAGIEVGYGMPGKSFTKEWNIPSSSPTYIGELKWNDEIDFWNPTWWSDYYTRSVKDEITVTAIPVMGRLEYNAFSNESIRARAGVGLGTYIVNVKTVYTDTITFGQDAYPYKTGETIIEETTYNETVALGAVELTAGLEYKLNESISLNVGGNYTMLGKKDIYMDVDSILYYPNGPTTDPVYPSKLDVKNGVEIGGNGIGFSAGVSLKF